MSVYYFSMPKRHPPPMSRVCPGRTTGHAGHKPSVMSKNDMVQLADGTQIPLCRPNSVNDKDWVSVKDYLTNHPNEAMALQKSAQGGNENPMQVDQFREEYSGPAFLHAVNAKTGGLTQQGKVTMRTPPEACNSGDVEGVKKPLEAGTNPDTKNWYRPNSVNDKEWALLMDYLKTHPNEAMGLQKFARLSLRTPCSWTSSVR